MGGVEREPTLRPGHLENIRWASEELGGTWWTKPRIAGVGLPGLLGGGPGLYLDALWVPAGPSTLQAWADDPEGFEAALSSGSPAHGVVARGYADRTVFGLLLAAQDLLALRCSAIGAIGGIALSESNGHDLNMDWVYHRHGFEVVELPARQAP